MSDFLIALGSLRLWITAAIICASIWVLLQLWTLIQFVSFLIRE